MDTIVKDQKIKILQLFQSEYTTVAYRTRYTRHVDSTEGGMIDKITKLKSQQLKLTHTHTQFLPHLYKNTTDTVYLLREVLKQVLQRETGYKFGLHK